MFTNILIPALAVGATGLAFGALLGFASIVFKVDKDERIDKITELLPGANCGGCGYAGCAALAEAIVANGEAATKCNLMTAEKNEIICEMMGVKAGDIQKKTARLKCAGTCDACGNKYDFTGIDDCYTAMQLNGGPKSCEFGCMGLGSCVGVCEFDAIKALKHPSSTYKMVGNAIHKNISADHLFFLPKTRRNIQTDKIIIYFFIPPTLSNIAYKRIINTNSSIYFTFIYFFKSINTISSA